MDTKDKRVKREIANSNERRRMQSINAGFQKLKRLLPVNESEKLSKAAILQNASDFIQQIQREKLILYEQNTLLRGILMEIKGGTDVSVALRTIDLDALPTIPISTHSHTHNNSNDDTSLDPNNNNDCTRSVSSSSSGGSSCNNSVNTNNNTNNTATPIIHKSSVTRNGSNKEVKRNGNKEVKKENNVNNNNCDINTTTNTTTTTNAYSNINDKHIDQELPNNQSIASDITCPKNGVAKAAIALPLEVPCYTRLDLLIHAASSDLSK